MDDDDDDDEISNYVDLYKYMLGGGWKGQDLQGLLWWIIIELCLQQNENIVMSDSEDSTVTYTEVSSPFEDLSDIESPGVNGLPMMPEDPYAYVVAAFQAPPSPDYVPGPEKPEQAPPSLEFVPKPVYPEFMPPEDEEDLEEDPDDYPIDGGDDDEDDDDVEEDEDEDKEEEEEHPSPTDSVPPPVHHVTARMSIRD
ncbi:hypothetical protein Tco_1344115 [Tanacetum coccineum]